MSEQPTPIGNRVVPNLLVRDMEASLAFYTGVLDFRLTGRTPGEAPPGWAEVSRDGVTFWLHVGAPEGTPAEPEGEPAELPGRHAQPADG